MASSDPLPPPHGNLLDTEEAAEITRLLEQDKILTQAIGHLIPEELDISSMEQVLDIGCGPGGWALDVAFTYPHLQVQGIDINHTMANFANARARSQYLNNATFLLKDARDQFDTDDSTVDFVNARTIFVFMDQQSWPALIAECWRILKPGGTLCITEAEIVISNSPAMQQLNRFLSQSLYTQGRTFSVDGHSFGVAFMLKKLLMNASFENIRHKAFSLDASYGSDAHYNACKDGEIFFQIVKPHLVASGIVEEAEFDRLYYEMLIDTLSDDYTCITFGLSAWGSKPQ